MCRPMAGSIAKAFGGIFLALGIIGIVAGIALGVMAGQDERDNQDSIVQDGQRSDENEAIMIGAVAAAAIGVVLAIFGIIFLAVGGQRARKELVRASAGSPSNAGTDGTDGKADKTRGAAASGVAVTPIARTPRPVTPEEARRNSRNTLIGTLAFLGAGLIVFMIIQAGGGGDLFRNSEPSMLSQPEDLSGTVRYAGLAQSLDQSGDNIVAFTAPADTARIVVAVNWTVAAQGGADSLSVQFEHNDGAWRTLASDRGPAVIMFEEVGEFAGVNFRVVVSPAESDQLIFEQPFSVTVSYWDS